MFGCSKFSNWSFACMSSPHRACSSKSHLRVAVQSYPWKSLGAHRRTVGGLINSLLAAGGWWWSHLRWWTDLNRRAVLGRQSSAWCSRRCQEASGSSGPRELTGVDEGLQIQEAASGDIKRHQRQGRRRRACWWLSANYSDCAYCHDPLTCTPCYGGSSRRAMSFVLYPTGVLITWSTHLNELIDINMQFGSSLTYLNHSNKFGDPQCNLLLEKYKCWCSHCFRSSRDNVIERLYQCCPCMTWGL